MTSRRQLAAVLAATVLLAACDGEATTSATSHPTAAAKPTAPAPPALCGRLTPRITGRVQAGAATELSGLVLSRSQPRVLWAHNDSGDRPRVLALEPDGRLLADVEVTGAQAVDWEDIAATKDALYLGDIGDNLRARETVTVYRVPEPRIGATSAAAEPLTLRYPDGAHDAEALLADQTTGGLVIVTKDGGGASRVYTAANPSPTGVTTMRLARTLALGLGQAVTAGDVSGDGRTVALRTYDRAFVWRRAKSESITAALRRKPCVPKANLLAEGQGEALALTATGRSFYTVPEGASPALRVYRR